MNIKKLQELVELMNENDLNEIEVEMEGMKVKLVKGGGAVAPVVYHHAPVAAPAKAEDAAAQAAPDKASNLKEVKSPMVGTFYRSSAPDAEPYVEVGSMVQKGRCSLHR
jgi:biotin carboxyl carrier protein